MLPGMTDWKPAGENTRPVRRGQMPRAGQSGGVRGSFSAARKLTIILVLATFCQSRGLFSGHHQIRHSHESAPLSKENYSQSDSLGKYRRLPHSAKAGACFRVIISFVIPMKMGIHAAFRRLRGISMEVSETPRLFSEPSEYSAIQHRLPLSRTAVQGKFSMGGIP